MTHASISAATSKAFCFEKLAQNAIFKCSLLSRPTFKFASALVEKIFSRVKTAIALRTALDR